MKVAFASIEGLIPFADIQLSLIPTIQEKGCKFFLLTLEDYLKVYKASSKDSYRANKNNHKDLAKIAYINEKSDCEHTNYITPAQLPIRPAISSTNNIKRG